jgi:hypothetical protein
MGVVRGVGFAAFFTECFFGQRARNVVVVGDERVVAAGQPIVTASLHTHGVTVTGVRPPLGGGLTRSRDHAGDGGSPFRAAARRVPLV